jgi:hypothetical protein
MSILRLREFCFVLGIGLLTVLTFGCVDPDEGNGYGGGMGLDYYEPAGYVFGGWNPGYFVGPTRGGNQVPVPTSSPAPHTYKDALASRPLPSIPSVPRSKGSSVR